jgi:hypothetical protein
LSVGVMAASAVTICLVPIALGIAALLIAKWIRRRCQLDELRGVSVAEIVRAVFGRPPNAG